MSVKYHIDVNGEAVPCPAKIQCTKKGSDGQPAPHFTGSPQQAQEWAEKENAREMGGNLGSAVKKDKQINKMDERQDVADNIAEEYSISDYEIDVIDDHESLMSYRIDDISLQTTFSDEESLRSNMIDDMEKWESMDHHFDEIGNDYIESQDIKDIDRTIQKVNLTANDMRRDEGHLETNYDTIDTRVNDEINNFVGSGKSVITNDEKADVDTISDMISKDYDLSHGNSEVFDQDGEIFIHVEAPNHATFQVVHNPETDGESIGDVRNSLLEMSEFDADERFDEIWSDDFGNHNGFSPDEFYVKLKSDEAYFKKRSLEIEEDIYKN